MAHSSAEQRVIAAPERARWQAVLLAFLFGGFVATVTFAFYRERSGFSDEGSFCTIAQGILGGRLPYRDLFNEKPPLEYFWTAAVMAFSGPTLIGARIASSIVMALTIACIVLSPLRRRGNELVALGVMLATAAIAIQMEAYRNTADTTLALLFVGSVICVGREPRKVGNAVVAGALQGLALGFRQTAGASALVMILSPGLKRLRVAFAFGVVGGLLAWLIPLAATGTFIEFVKATVLFHVGNATAASYMLQGADHRAGPLVWLLLLAAISFGSRRSRAERIWAVCWLVTAAMVYFGRKEEFRLWPSAAAALAMLAWEDGLLTLPSFALRGRPAALVAVAALLAGGAALRHVPPRHLPVEAAAQALKSMSRPGQEVWVGPFAPYIYCLAERRPASRYYFLLPWTDKTEVRHEIVQQILTKRPILVIDRLSTGTIYDIDRLMPEFSQILGARYQMVTPAGFAPDGRFVFYRPNPTDVLPPPSTHVVQLPRP